MLWRVWALKSIAVAAGGDLGELAQLSAEQVGFTGGWGSVPENRRLELRHSAGWRWEFPGEPAAYTALQEKRMAEIMALDHYQERLDNFVQYTQSRTVKNFTEKGFDMVVVDANLTKRLQKRLHEKLDMARREGQQPLQGIYGPSIPKFIDHGERDILAMLKPLLEAWVSHSLPDGLLPVTAYGIRVYERGSSLAWHTDRVDTHVISGIYHISHHYDDPSRAWPIEIEGHDGLRHAVDLPPGHMLLYESAKCPHGRPKMLEGEHYASIFVHYRPRNREPWPYTHNDIWLAVPPGWDANVRIKDPNDPGERWAGAFLTHDSMAVHGMADRKESVRMDEYPPPQQQQQQLKAASQLRRRKAEEPEQLVPVPQRALPKAVQQNLAAQRQPAPSPAVRRDRAHRFAQVYPKARDQVAAPLEHFDDDDAAATVAVFSVDDDDDDDDDVVRVAAVGGSLLLAGLYACGGCALISTIGVLLRRAYVTRGRSLLRCNHVKTDTGVMRASEERRAVSGSAARHRHDADHQL